MAGNSLVSYRAEIGRFNMKCTNLCPLNGHALVLFFVSNFGFLFWLFLLIIVDNDVEKNPGPNLINGILLNTRSVKSVNARRNKLALIQSLVTLKNAAIVCLTETWLSKDIRNEEIFPCGSYQIFRKDRDGYGGVLVAVHESIKSKERPDLIPHSDTHNETVVVELRLPKLPKIALVTHYRPPSDNSYECAHNFRQTLNNIRASNFNTIWTMGDFNLPNLDTESGLPLDNSSVCEMYYNIFQDFSLLHLIHVPTHRNGNTLDFILSNEPDLFGNISVEKDIFPSDHYLINFNIHVTLLQPEKVSRIVYNYRKADWIGLRSAISNSNLGEILRTYSSDISQACEQWTVTFREIIDKYIPRHKIKNINSPPWIDGDVLHLSNKKETAHRKAIKKNTPESWNKYKRLRNKLRNLVDFKYDKYIEDSTAAVCDNPKRFWGLLRSKMKNKNTPLNLYDEAKSCTSSKDKASMFNNFFYSNFTNTNGTGPFPYIHEFINPNLNKLEISIAETRLILDNIDPNKATGPDDISGRILKECSKEISPSLTMLFNMSLDSGIVPNMWKRANVVPVFKKGEKTLCSNYRPISLLCIVSKVLERALLNQIKNEIIPLITKFQHGFLNGKSTETQMLSVFDNISKVLDDGGQTDIIYLDFSKAFDSVPHHLLLHKMKSFGFNGTLLSWFSNYISNRRQRVVIEGENSEWLPVLSGVPQGSILGPVLFILYVNDMVTQVSENTSVNLFADDAKVVRTINCRLDYILLQRDINQLFDWSNTWLLNFNITKCKLLRIARVVRYCVDYFINDVKLECVNEFTDLGIMISSNLSWHSHITSKVKRANSLLGFIKRTCGFNAPVECKRILYLALMRSTIMYGSTVWCPNRGDMKLLEGVQRRATKYILNDYTSDYKSRLQKTKLIPLNYYKEYRDICFLYKCINGFYNIDINDFIKFQNHSHYQTRMRTNKPSMIYPTRSNTVKGAEFFFNRIVSCWNILPSDIKSLKCKNKDIWPFKNKLLEYYQHRTSTVFQSDNICTWTSSCRCPICRQS